MISSAKRPATASTPRLRALLSAVIPLLLVAGCGDQKPHPVGPHPAVVIDAGLTPVTDAASARAAPDETECGTLVTHVLELAMAKFRADAQAQGKPIPTEAQLTKIRDDLTGELMAGCRNLDRAIYDCAMAATDIEGYLGCEPTDRPGELTD